MRIIVVGDVHGCLYELEALLEKIGVANDDLVISVGDLVDRGPHSVETVRFCRENGVILVRGNHEDNYIRFREHSMECLKSGKKNPKADKFRGEFASIYNGLAEEDWDYLESSECYWKGAHGELVVHGGVPTNLRKLPSPAMNKDDKKAQAMLLRIRTVNEKGQMLSLREERAARSKGDHVEHWASVYDGRFGYVFFGHDQHKYLRKFDFATGLDTGCVFGGRLTAAIIDGNEICYDSVAAKKKYHDRSK